MRICFIAGVGSVHTQRWVKYFANKGHEVHLITIGSSEVQGINNVRLHELNILRPQIRIISYGANLIFNAMQVRKLLKEIKPDLINAHYIMNWGFLGVLSGFHPFILTVWGSDVLIDPKRYLPVKILTKYALAKADLITCDGENMLRGLTNLNTQSEKIRLIYFGVDTQLFSPVWRDEKIKEELGMSNSPVIISCRHLRAVYDVESLVKAVPLVLEKAPEAQFIIGSDGYQKDYLKSLAASLGVSGSIKFIGWINHGELPRHLASSDIYVSTSLSEGGVSITTMEAMACGLTVIVTDTGDNKKWIKDGISGYIIPVRSPEILASKIIFLLRNSEVRRKLALTNRQIVEEKANYQKEMDKMERLYESVVKRDER